MVISATSENNSLLKKFISSSKKPKKFKESKNVTESLAIRSSAVE